MSDLAPVFSDLARIMRQHTRGMDIKKDTSTDLYVDTHYIQKNRKPLYFGGVQVKKSYVSYHLMPVYVEPALLKGISKELKARMQGKACFNFASVDKALFRELAGLTAAGVVYYKKHGFLKSK
ncbi:MAG: hypothetical protein ACT4UQ_11825 [Gammaproteobacteria bacterium]